MSVGDDSIAGSRRDVTTLSRKWAWITSSMVATTCFLLMTMSAWPGWMSPDSLDMWRQATGSTEINDWHTPILTYWWRLVGASVWGPIAPFLLQMAALWAGVWLVTQALLARVSPFGVLLAPGLLLVGHTWTTAWIWKDAFALSLVSLALGLLCRALIALTPQRRLAWLAAAIAVLSLATWARLYLLPVVLLGSIALWLLVRQTSPDAQPRPSRVLRLSTFALLAVPLAVAGLGKVITDVVIQPLPGYFTGTWLVDVARLDCAPTGGKPVPRDERRVPPEFIVPGTGSFCDDYSYIDASSTVRREAGQERLQNSSDPEALALLRSRWLDGLTDDPVAYIYPRMLTFSALVANPAWAPVTLSSDAPNFLVNGGIGGGSEAGWESNGGSVLFGLLLQRKLVTDWPLTAPFFGPATFWVLLLPIGIAIWTIVARRPRFTSGLVAGLAFPGLFVVTFAALAPTPDTRYVAPAVIWSILFCCGVTPLLYRLNPRIRTQRQASSR